MAFLGGLLLTVALVPLLRYALREPPELPPARAPSDDELLHAALEQARENCLLVARQSDPATRGPWVPLRVDAIQRVLTTERILSGSYGELPAIEAELVWLSRIEGRKQLRARNLEDVRFLVGAIHWYLEGALETPSSGECHFRRAPIHDPGALQEFAGLEFSDLLSEWD